MYIFATITLAVIMESPWIGKEFLDIIDTVGKKITLHSQGKLDYVDTRELPGPSLLYDVGIYTLKSSPLFPIIPLMGQAAKSAHDLAIFAAKLKGFELFPLQFRR